MGLQLVRRTAPQIALAAALSVALVGCAPTPTVVSGRIVDDTVTIQAPDLPMPAPVLDSASSSAAENRSGTPGATNPASALTGLGSVIVIDEITVAEGDRVATGDVIARLDAAALDVNVAAARADLASAKAQVGVLDDAIETVRDNRATVAEKRSEVGGTIAELVRTRAQLAAKLAQLRALLKRVESLGPMIPPPGSTPATLPPGAKPPGGGAAPPDPAELKAAIAQLEAGIAQLDAGLTQARGGLARLSSASGDLADARAQLGDLRELARIAVPLSRVSVRVAEYERSLAEIRTPYAGVVTSVLADGDVVFPGASVATIRRDGPARVTTWLPAAMVARLAAEGAAGPAAFVSADWAPGETFSARLSRVGTRALYPPSSFATEEVHLTRAIPVELTLDDAALGAPAGGPVDVLLGE